jgi:hypothetical protein
VLGHIEITGAGTGRHRVGMKGDVLVLGSGAGAQIRVQAPGVEDEHLRFSRLGTHVRVEPVRAGATVDVNGEPLYCKDLDDGDVIEVAGLQLRWIAAQKAVSVPASAAARGSRSRRDEPSDKPARKSRSQGMPGSLRLSLVVLGVLVAGFVAMRLSKQIALLSPEEQLELAREQMGNHRREMALATLDELLPRASGTTLQEATDMRAAILRIQAESAEMPKVIAARGAQEVLIAFHTRYLEGASNRPPAREFVRQCDDWLAEHGELCRRHSDGKHLAAWVEEHRARHLAQAALGEPDTATDVTFAVESRLRFQWRDYRGAIRALERYLAANDDATVRRLREETVAAGEEWLQGKLRYIDQIIDRGDLGNAGRDLEQIERWSMLPQWEPLVRERQRRLAAAR